MYNVSYLNLPYDIYTVIYSFLFYRELLPLIFISKESKKIISESIYWSYSSKKYYLDFKISLSWTNPFDFLSKKIFYPKKRICMKCDKIIDKEYCILFCDCTQKLLWNENQLEVKPIFHEECIRNRSVINIKKRKIIKLESGSNLFYCLFCDSKKIGYIGKYFI